MDLSVVLQILVAGSGWQFRGDCGMFMMIYIYIYIQLNIYICIYITIYIYIHVYMKIMRPFLWILSRRPGTCPCCGYCLFPWWDCWIITDRHSYVVVWCVEVLFIHVYSTISPHINGQDTKLYLSCLFLHRRSPKIWHWLYQVYSWCACSVRDVACVWFSASDQLRFTSCYRCEALASSRWEGHIRGRLEEDWEDVPIVPNSESCATTEVAPLVSKFAEPLVRSICLLSLFLTDWDTVLFVLLCFIGMRGRRPQHEAVNLIWSWIG